MPAESNVGARLFLIGKAGVLAGLKEVQAAVARLNAEIAAGGKAYKAQAAGSDEAATAMERQTLVMDTYRRNLATTTAATDALARVGKVAFFTITAAAAAWGYESVKWAQQYQTALVQLQTQAGLTKGAMEAIGKAARVNASSLGISPTAYVQAAYHPASAGFGARTVPEAIAITNSAAKLAAIGGSPVETTVNALTGVMKSYNLKPGQTLKTAALLNAIIGAGNMHAATLNAALASGVAGTAKTFGVSIASLGGAIAFLTDRGMPAAQAGTHLRMTLALLGAPSQRAGTILRAAGMSTTAIQKSTNAMAQLLQEYRVQPSELSRALRTNGGKGGIYNALHLLKTHLVDAGLTKEMQGALISGAFGGGRMGSTIMMMYNSVTSLGQKATKIERHGSTKAFLKDWQKETRTLDFQLHRLGGEIETLGTAFGTKLVPPLTKAVSKFIDLLKWLQKNKGVAYALAGTVTSLLVPAIGVYLYRALLSSGGAIRTVFRGYTNLIRGNRFEQIALEQTRTQLQFTAAETNALAGADERLAGASSTAAGRIAVEDTALAGGSAAGGLGGIGMAGAGGFKMMAGQFAAKGATGGLMAMIEAQLFNQYLKKPVTKRVGKRGETDISDALTGAMAGMMFGPEGALAGAALGALWGERGHLRQDLHAEGTGFDFVRHHIAAGADAVFHDLFGGGSEAPARPVPLTIHNHVTVELTGREVTKGVRTHVRREAARAGS